MFTPWECAHGEASIVRLECLPTVNLSPDDDSVDTNTVAIYGTGSIVSFGECSRHIVMRVKFEPLADGPIYLYESYRLALLVKNGVRTIRDIAFGSYQCDGNGVWSETYFQERT